MGSKTRGYVLLGLGKFYVSECEKLVETLRAQDDHNPVSIVVDSMESITHLNYFDNIINFSHLINSNTKLFNECKTSFEKYCLFPRLFYDKLAIYDDTIFIDSDVLCIAPTNHVWNILVNLSQPFNMLGNPFNPNWLWGDTAGISNKIGLRIPETHGGFFHIRKNNNNCKEICDYAKKAFLTYEGLGFKKVFRGGATDEPCFAYAFARMNYVPLDFYSYPIMTFNLQGDHQIPTRIQTVNNLYVEMQTPHIAFCHFFEKQTGNNYKTIYERIMKGNNNG